MLPSYIPDIKPGSSGVIDQIEIEDLGENQIFINTLNVRMYQTQDYTGYLNDYVVLSDTFTITFNIITYIIVNYNNGTPILDLTTDIHNLNNSNNILVAIVFNDQSEIHYIVFNNSANGAIDKHTQRLILTRGFLRQTGLSLSEYGARYLKVSPGKIWFGIKQFVTAEVESDIDEFLYQWYHDPNNILDWINIKTTGSYNNTHYDDSVLGYKELTDGKYGVNWVYLIINDDENELMYTQSTSQFDSLSLAQASTIPLTPDIINSNGLLVGRVIFLKGASTGFIESSFNTLFTGTQINIHNSLLDLDGGKGDEYYHLTHQDYDTLVGSEDADLLHTHDLKSNTDHTHDDRYYTEDQNDVLLSGKADSVHLHTKVNISDFTESDYVHTTADESIAGVKTFTGNQQVNGQIIRPFSGLTLSTTNNNVVIGSFKNFRITGPTSNFTITGITGGVDGREILLYNTVGYRMIIANENVGSLTANRISTLSNGDIQTTTQGVVSLIYDGTSSRWINTGLVV
jgi:hypothetical protein